MDIFKADLDGKNLVRLTDAPTATTPRAATRPTASRSSSRRSATATPRSTSWTPTARTPAGSSQAKGYDGGPFFSPDGKRIIYRSDRKGNDLLQIYRQQPRGHRRAGADRATTFVNWGPFLHPDSRHIVYSTSRHGHPNYEIYLMDVDTGAEERITYHDGFDGLPVFSPDGKQLMWTSNGRGTDRNSQLFIADFTLDPAPPDRRGE